MFNKIRYQLVLIFSICLSIHSFAQGKYYVIDKGTVKGNYTIKLVEQDQTLTPDNFFSITNLRLKTNAPSPKDLNAAGYKRKNLITYKITIERTSDHKVFYGRMAFYGMIKKPYIVNQAVASYYNIEIGSTFFSMAHDGITACVYEYYTRKPLDPLKFPTWVIWFSDVPIGDEVSTNNFNTDDDKENVMYKGRNNFSVGMGFYNLNAKFLSQAIAEDSYISNSTVTFTQLRPIFIKYEYAVSRRFSLGLNYSYNKMNGVYDYVYKNPSTLAYALCQETIDLKIMALSIRANWHFAVGKHFEMYGGPGIGFATKTTIATSNNTDSFGVTRHALSAYFFSKSTNSELKQTNPIADFNLGFRIYFTKNFGIYAEGATARSAIQTGLVLGF